jgi:thiamine transport system ATP-binding protein
MSGEVVSGAGETREAADREPASGEMAGDAEVTHPGLRITEVSVRYDDTTAIDRVSLTVAGGETLAVVGPSGSGKSTLLRAIAGLEPVVAGRIEAGGVDLGTLPVHLRDLGLMFQDHALFPHLDVAGNVAFGLRRRGWPRRRRNERVAELLDLVGLAGYQRRAVHQLSGGEAQRVALARALGPEPGLLMLDEPFGSLDRVLRHELMAEVRLLLDRLGQTAIHVTHDQAEAFALADRVAVLRQGRLVQIDAPARLWSRPASAFVATFVGQPNVWPVDVADDGTIRLIDGRYDRRCDRRFVLGRRPDLEPGRSALLIPAAAVGLDPTGRLEAEVMTSRFREGNHRVTAALISPEPRAGTGDQIVRGDGQSWLPDVAFDQSERLRVGRVVRLEIDLDQAVQIDWDRCSDPVPVDRHRPISR